MIVYLAKSNNFHSILFKTDIVISLPSGPARWLGTKRPLGQETRMEVHLELQVVHWWGGHHTVEWSKPVLVLHLFTIELKLGLAYFAIHVKCNHGLKEKGTKKSRKPFERVSIFMSTK